MEQKQLDELDETPIEEYIEEVDEVEEFKAKKKAYKKQSKKSPWREEDLEITSATDSSKSESKSELSSEEARVEIIDEEPEVRVTSATTSASTTISGSAAAPHNPWADEDLTEKPSGTWWKVLLGVVAAILIIGVLMYGVRMDPANPPSSQPPASPPVVAPVTPPVVAPPAAPPQALPTTTTSLTLNAKRWIFTPQTITVEQGDHVELTIVPEALKFTFAIPELGVEEDIDGKTTIKFDATQKGTFRFTCASCEEYRGMEGTLIVR